MNTFSCTPPGNLNDWSRRHFLLALGAGAMAPGFMTEAFGASERRIVPVGPGSKYAPKIWAAFVRRKGDYGMLWPGEIYDGEKALRDYSRQIEQAQNELGLKIKMRTEPLYSLEDAEQWLAEAKADKPDGLLIVLLDRQAHAWPTAAKATETGIPTIIFSPLGTSFTTNTAPLAHKEGTFISSSIDFTQARYGLKMIKAAAKLREMRFIVIKGTQRQDVELPFFKTKLRYIPAQNFLDEYNATPTSEEIQGMAKEYLRQATRIVHATKDDVINGIKSYVVARNILEREKGDGITMDCLGALGKTKVSLPCIAWSKMLDHAIPAACEADLGAAVTHALVQSLFDRPGFQQDPVPETARECLIGAHCSCATRLNGFKQKPEPFEIIHHHGNRDAVPRPTWRIGQRVTVMCVIPEGRASRSDEPKQALAKEGTPRIPEMVISTGSVADNISAPPAGGCVVSVMLKLDTKPDLLTYPGFHQLFFYGDYKKELLAYCQLFGIKPLVV